MLLQLEDHDKALRLLVQQLNDHAAAESYCLQNSRNRDVTQQRELFHTLLSIYLDPRHE